jgi:DNA-binding HxlR family transcriptional regulator
MVPSSEVSNSCGGEESAQAAAVAPQAEQKAKPADGILSADYPLCPFRNVISRFSDKWSLLILYVLSSSERPLRFSELERQIADISSRVLSSCLRTLEADDLVSRKVYPEVPPKVEYSLTPLGRTLIPHLVSLTNWAIENFDHVVAHRARYEKK